MDQINKMLGNDIVKDAMVEQIGDAAKGLAKNILSGGGDQKEEGKGEEKGGGLDVGDIVSCIGGGNKDDKGGFGIEDALKFVDGGDKDKDEGGSNVVKTLGNLFG